MDFITELAILSYSDSRIDTKTLLECAHLAGIEWVEGAKSFSDHSLIFELEHLRSNSSHLKLVEWLHKQKIKAAPIGSLNYPPEFLELERPPKCLWYVGQPVWMKSPSLGVVGTRNPSSTSLRWMNQHFSHFLANHELAVVSGGAVGIDQRAHILSIAKSRPTVAWMPLGISARYPRDFYKLEGPILDSGGAVVSAFSPSWPIFKSNFLERNQLIASQCRLTFVIEARLRSGTMLTAKMAGHMGRPIAALPGGPLDASSFGNLELLVQGAALIRDATDLAAAWALA